MLQTYVRSSRDLRNNYAEIARLVRENNQVIITNQGRGESVLISMEEYARYEEYLHTRYVERIAYRKRFGLYGFVIARLHRYLNPGSFSV